MTRCLRDEPVPPNNPAMLDAWCAAGYSARPVQEHIGDEGEILWINAGDSLCVRFDDGDERLLYRQETEVLTSG